RARHRLREVHRLPGLAADMPPGAEAWSVRESDFPKHGTPEEKLRFLVRYAILAPSPRNSQPWRFEVDARRVCVYADLSRALHGADPGKRDLYVSLGCASRPKCPAASTR